MKDLHNKNFRSQAFSHLRLQEQTRFQEQARFQLQPYLSVQLKSCLAKCLKWLQWLQFSILLSLGTHPILRFIRPSILLFAVGFWGLSGSFGVNFHATPSSSAVMSPSVNALYAQDLWDDSQGFFTATRQLPIGTIIEIVFDDDFDFLYDLETTKNKLGQYNDISLLEEFLSPLLGNRGNALEGTRDISIRSRERINGGIGAVITAYDPLNKTYTLNVARQLDLNNQERGTLNFIAQVNGEHISETKTISSTKLANLTIRYQNKQNNITFSRSDFEKLNFPTQDEIAVVRERIRQIKLADQRKRAEQLEAEQLQAEQVIQDRISQLVPGSTPQTPSQPPQFGSQVPSDTPVPLTSPQSPAPTPENGTSSTDSQPVPGAPIPTNTTRSVTNQIIGQIPTNTLRSVTNRIIVQPRTELPESELPPLPQIEIELTETKKREIFLELLNIIVDDWF